jgi:hypothetical protein
VTRLVRVALATGLAVIAASGTARAQDAFVQATIGADVRRFSGEDTQNVFDAAARTLTVAAGGFLTARVSGSVELDDGARAATLRTVSLAISGRPATITTRYALRRRTITALFGIHSAARRRARIGAYAGLAFSSIRREVSSDAPPIVLSEPAAPSVFVDRAVDLVVGTDLAVAVGPRLAVVAGLRAQGLSLAGGVNGMSVRPAAGVRVAF